MRFIYTKSAAEVTTNSIAGEAQDHESLIGVELRPVAVVVGLCICISSRNKGCTVQGADLYGSQSVVCGSLGKRQDQSSCQALFGKLLSNPISCQPIRLAAVRRRQLPGWIN